MAKIYSIFFFFDDFSYDLEPMDEDSYGVVTSKDEATKFNDFFHRYHILKDRLSSKLVTEFLICLPSDTKWIIPAELSIDEDSLFCETCECTAAPQDVKIQKMMLWCGSSCCPHHNKHRVVTQDVMLNEYASKEGGAACSFKKIMKEVFCPNQYGFYYRQYCFNFVSDTEIVEINGRSNDEIWGEIFKRYGLRIPECLFKIIERYDVRAILHNIFN